MVKSAALALALLTLSTLPSALALPGFDRNFDFGRNRGGFGGNNNNKVGQQNNQNQNKQQNNFNNNFGNNNRFGNNNNNQQNNKSQNNNKNSQNNNQNNNQKNVPGVTLHNTNDAVASATAAAAANTVTAAASATTTDAAEAAAASASSLASLSSSISANIAAESAAAANNQDAQTSLSLDPSQVQSNLEQNGQAVQEAGQVPSLTSVNNFINFCLTRPDLPLTNGQQVITGSCNPTVMGDIIPKASMPSAKFVNPLNLANIKSNTTIAFQLAVTNMETGNFVNAETNYFAAPQQLNSQNQLIAHSHITVNAIKSFQDTTVHDPQVFAFFKGLNAAAVNGILEADATGGLPDGFYRACSINTAANHQPALVAVAQHASLDDCIYFQVSANGDSGDASDSTTSAAVRR
jgi:hypothetical protein